MASLLRTASRRVSFPPARRSNIRCRLLSITHDKKAGIQPINDVSNFAEPDTAEIKTKRKLDSQVGRASRVHFKRKEKKGSQHLGTKRLDLRDYSAEGLLKEILGHQSASIVFRDACKCSKCKDQSTSQRDFNVAHIPTNIQPESLHHDEQGNVVVRWQNDISGWEDHVSVFTPHQIERLRVWKEGEYTSYTDLWNQQQLASERFAVSYTDFMNSDRHLAQTLFQFARHGLVFIEDVPEDPQSVARLAGRIGRIKSTFYGDVWDVKSVPNATNVAYTNKYLGFHSDLMYIKESPTVQLLHCIHNSCAGGESRFVDQFKALDILYSEDGELARTLAETTLRYEYDNSGYFYTDIKPIVEFATSSYPFPKRYVRGLRSEQVKTVSRMFWAPQFLGSILSNFGVEPEMLQKRLRAMKKYSEILERKDLVYEEKMIPGTCVMFDNLRVLHARNEYDMNTGKRWLRGTYIDGQDLWSTEMKLKDLINEFSLAELGDSMTDHAMKQGAQAA